MLARCVSLKVVLMQSECPVVFVYRTDFENIMLRIIESIWQ